MFGRKRKSPDSNRDTPSSRVMPAFATRQSPMRPFWSLLCGALAVLAVLACVSYQPEQPVLAFLAKWLAVSAGVTPTSSNLVGTVGTTYAAASNWLGGAATLIFVPLFALWLAYLFMFRRAHSVRAWKFVLMALTLLAACGLLDVLFVWLGRSPSPYFQHGYGGWIGQELYSVLLKNSLGKAGSLVVLGLVYAVGLLFVFSDQPGQSIEWWLQSFSMWRQDRALAKKARTEKLVKDRAATLAAAQAAKAQAAAAASAQPSAQTPAKVVAAEPAAPPVRGHGSLKLGQNVNLLSEVSPDESVLARKFKEAEQMSLPGTPDGALGMETSSKGKAGRGSRGGDDAASSMGPKIIAEEKLKRAAPVLPQNKGDYIFPSISLLNQPQERKTDSAEVHEERAAQLVRTLAEFGVKVQQGNIYTGPVITRYEVIPAPGVRVEKIVNLDKNLALALKAESVRIIAPVPGKGTVGIEVPNRQPADVGLREIIESSAWVDSKAEIPIVLGKDVTGNPMVVDLTKMPHALIAGSTGAGKTVCINSIIASLLFKMAPEDLRFIMVDPKIVEMQGYNSLPHMLIPVVTNPKHVPAALKVLIQNMEHRYKMFAQVGARNIAGFNAKMLQDKDQLEKAEEMEAEMSPEERAATRDIEVPRDAGVIEIERKKLPYIVCIIDELADLMMVAPADIETSVARLAQLARAAGIHLILATQRPSVNVITGVIKANLPCRIAFKVASKVDSRTILDTGGADALIGRGDMLFVPPGTSNLVRAQGAFVSDEEINKIVEDLKKNGEPEYDDDVQAKIEAGVAGDEEDEEDEDDVPEGEDEQLAREAIEVLKATKRASTSMLQRRLKIGYNRAARIMEILEAEGIVGPENGSSPREILKDLEML